MLEFQGGYGNPMGYWFSNTPWDFQGWSLFPAREAVEGCNHPPPENQLYQSYFCILNNKKHSKGLTRPYLHRVQELPWSFNGPYRAPKLDLMVFEKISGRVYQFYIFYSVAPLTMLGHLFGHFPTLPRLRGPSWTFMDPARLISGHPW